MTTFAFPGRAAALALAAALSLSALPAFAHDFKVGDLIIDHPFSRATPPMARVGAGYLTITNTGATTDRLVSVACDCAKAAEIHEMKMDGNVMKMQQLPDGVAIPAGGSAALAPGGNHLMFIGLKHGFVEGETFQATLTFEKAGPVTVEFAIGPLRPMKGHGMPHKLDKSAN
ncbi:MAG: copper chaperone PCu(A)C [Alphaproteobacteria bacterium]|nr:copper chaperone PCu(A)C [Alphaproteobacteria bacterium]MCB9930243.1 copper chaperone PCu(A)C [Alphaproteobacteria bacterium]